MCVCVLSTSFKINTLEPNRITSICTHSIVQIDNDPGHHFKITCGHAKCTHTHLSAHSLSTLRIFHTQIHLHTSFILSHMNKKNKRKREERREKRKKNTHTEATINNLLMTWKSLRLIYYLFPFFFHCICIH